jgi:hypothetical protein
MGVRTVRLDAEAEKALAYIVHTTGLSISGALKQGLLVLRTQLAQQTSPAPYDLYAELDLGLGGYAIAPSTETRRGVQEAVNVHVGCRGGARGPQRAGALAEPSDAAPGVAGARRMATRRRTLKAQGQGAPGAVQNRARGAQGGP